MILCDQTRYYIQCKIVSRTYVLSGVDHHAKINGYLKEGKETHAVVKQSNAVCLHVRCGV